jgi:ankyrin repeat protein
LIDAVKAGNREAIRALLKNKTDVNVAEADGTTALHWAVRADDVESVQALLRAGAKANIANRNGITPLSLAALNGTRIVVEALIEAGADVNALLPQGQTALMMAARAGHVDAINTLVSRGADVKAREQVMGETAVIWAAAENHPDVIKALVARGADVNGRSNPLTFPREEYGDGKSARLTVLPKGNWTPLMYAARQNASGALKALAESGANLNATDPDNMTALNLAIINAHYDAAAVLLDLGADPNIGDITGMTPLYAAVDLNTFADTPGRPTPKPSGKLDASAIVKALLDHGAKPERDPERANPRQGARSRRRDTRSRGDTPHARREERRRGDDAGAPGARRRSEVEDEGRNRSVDVCCWTGRSRTLHRRTRTSRPPRPTSSTRRHCAWNAVPTSTRPVRTVRQRCTWQ